METPDFEHGTVYFKQFGAERIKVAQKKMHVAKIQFHSKV